MNSLNQRILLFRNQSQTKPLVIINNPPCNKRAVFLENNRQTMLPLLKDRWVHPDGRYLERKPRKSALSDSPGGKLKNKCNNKKKGAPAMAVGVLTAIGKGWFVHKLHIYYKMQKRDGNSINICGGCRSSLRWAAICRLISGGYIIEIFLLFFPSPISISWRKCKPEASNWDGFVYIYQQYIVRELWKMPLVIFFFFSFVPWTPERSLWASIDLFLSEA